MNLLGIDYGRKRVGFAVAVTAAATVLPLTCSTSPEWNMLMPLVRRLVADYDISKIVIGWPLNMDGSPGSLCMEIEELQKRMAADLDLPVELCDERLTSFSAREIISEISPGTRKSRQAKDGLAAALILESFRKRP